MSKTLNFSSAAIALLAVVMLFGYATSASAATISNPLFSNGQTAIDVTGGSTVNGTFTLTVNAGEVCEVQRTQSDPSQPFTDISVGGQLGLQEQVYPNQQFSVKVPPNTGTYFPTVQCAGLFGGPRAINGGDGVVLGATPLGTVRVVANGTGTVGGSGDPTITALLEQITALLKQIDELKKQIANPPAPTKPAFCTGMVSYNGSNAWAAQAWLLGQPSFSGGFHAAGVFSPTGYWGSISQSASAQALNACK